MNTLKKIERKLEPYAIHNLTMYLVGGQGTATLLCLGAHDQNCSSYGAGAVDAGDTVMVIGTFGSCFVVLDHPNAGFSNWSAVKSYLSSCAAAPSALG